MQHLQLLTDNQPAVLEGFGLPCLHSFPVTPYSVPGAHFNIFSFQLLSLALKTSGMVQFPQQTPFTPCQDLVKRVTPAASGRQN